MPLLIPSYNVLHHTHPLTAASFVKFLGTVAFPDESTAYFSMFIYPLLAQPRPGRPPSPSRLPARARHHLGIISSSPWPPFSYLTARPCLSCLESRLPGVSTPSVTARTGPCLTRRCSPWTLPCPHPLQCSDSVIVSQSRPTSSRCLLPPSSPLQLVPHLVLRLVSGPRYSLCSGLQQALFHATTVGLCVGVHLACAARPSVLVARNRLLGHRFQSSARRLTVVRRGHHSSVPVPSAQCSTSLTVELPQARVPAPLVAAHCWSSPFGSTSPCPCAFVAPHRVELAHVLFQPWTHVPVLEFVDLLRRSDLATIFWPWRACAHRLQPRQWSSRSPPA